MNYWGCRKTRPRHEAAAETFDTFAALASSSAADVKSRAKSYLHLGLGLAYIDGVGTAASDASAEERLARAVELVMCCRAQTRSRSGWSRMPPTS